MLRSIIFLIMNTDIETYPDANLVLISILRAILSISTDVPDPVTQEGVDNLLPLYTFSRVQRLGNNERDLYHLVELSHVPGDLHLQLSTLANDFLNSPWNDFPTYPLLVPLLLCLDRIRGCSQERDDILQSLVSEKDVKQYMSDFWKAWRTGYDARMLLQCAGNVAIFVRRAAAQRTGNNNNPPQLGGVPSQGPLDVRDALHAFISCYCGCTQGDPDGLDPSALQFIEKATSWLGDPMSLDSNVGNSWITLHIDNVKRAKSSLQAGHLQGMEWHPGADTIIRARLDLYRVGRLKLEFPLLRVLSISDTPRDLLHLFRLWLQYVPAPPHVTDMPINPSDSNEFLQSGGLRRALRFIREPANTHLLANWLIVVEEIMPRWNFIPSALRRVAAEEIMDHEGFWGFLGPWWPSELRNALTKLFKAGEVHLATLPNIARFEEDGDTPSVSPATSEASSSLVGWTSQSTTNLGYPPTLLYPREIAELIEQGSFEIQRRLEGSAKTFLPFIALMLKELDNLRLEQVELLSGTLLKGLPTTLNDSEARKTIEAWLARQRSALKATTARPPLRLMIIPEEPTVSRMTPEQAGAIPDAASTLAPPHQRSPEGSHVSHENVNLQSGTQTTSI